MSEHRPTVVASAVASAVADTSAGERTGRGNALVCVPQRPAIVVICADPFEPLIDPDRARYVGPDETLADLAPNAPGAWLCFVDDRAILREWWHCAPPPGSVVQFRAVPQGGGGGSNPLRAVLQLAAMLAIAYFTGPAGLAWGDGVAAQLGRIGLTLVANALIANLVPVNSPARGGSPQYSASVQGNVARLGQPIPEIFGYDNGYPDIAAQPYSFYGRIVSAAPAPSPAPAPAPAPAVQAVRRVSGSSITNPMQAIRQSDGGDLYGHAPVAYSAFTGGTEKVIRRQNGPLGNAQSVTLGDTVYAFVLAGTNVYVASGYSYLYAGGGAVRRIGMGAFGTVAATYNAPLALDPQGLAWDGTQLWCSLRETGALVALHATTLAVLSTHALAPGCTAMAHSAGALFICDVASNQLVRWNIATTSQAWRVSCVAGPVDVMVNGAFVYVFGGTTVGVYDAATGAQLAVRATGFGSTDRGQGRFLFLHQGRVMHSEAGARVVFWAGATPQSLAVPAADVSELIGLAGGSVGAQFYVSVTQSATSTTRQLGYELYDVPAPGGGTVAPSVTTTTEEDNQQYLHCLLCVGVGSYRICRVSVGDTVIDNFSDVQIVRIGPNQSALDGPGTGVERISDQTLVDPRWVTSADVSGVEMRPGNYAGPYVACPRGSRVDILGIDLIQPGGMTREVRMRWRFEAQLIDDDEVALGPWVVLGSFTTTQRSNVPRRWGEDFPVAAGRYQVRVIRTDEIGRDLADIDTLSWLALRGHVVDNDMDVPGCTFLAIRIRASGQLSGGLRFRAMVRRLLPVWEGGTWSEVQSTRSPSWPFAYVLRSRGESDESIDLPHIAALAELWQSRFDSFDFRFDTQTSMWEALQTIARAGRAVPLIRNGRYTMVRDGPETAPVAYFGMRNTVRGSVRIKPKLATSQQMRALDVEYWDARRWTWVTVTAQEHEGQVYGYVGDGNRPAGVPAPDDNRRGRIKVLGIVGRNAALRYATYTLADPLYRDLDIELDSELDGQFPAPLSLTLFQHDLGDFGQSADVVAWDDGTLTLQATEPLRWAEGAGHAVRLVLPNGRLTAAIACTRGATDHEAALASAPLDLAGEPFTPITDAADRERTRLVFGTLGGVGALCKVRTIAPRDGGRHALRLVNEDDRVHSVDAAFIQPDELPPCVVAEIDEHNVYWLLNFDGTAGSAAAPDTSWWEHAAIVDNMVQADTAARFGGTGFSAAAPGTFSLSTTGAINVAWNPTTEGHTMEGFIRIASLPNASQFTLGEIRLSPGMGIRLWVNDDASPNFNNLVLTVFGAQASGPSFDGDAAIGAERYCLPLETYFHWAVDWNPVAATATAYINGSPVLVRAVDVGAVPGAGDIDQAVAASWNAPSAGFLALDGVRFTRRLRRYTGAFIPPTSAPTADV